MASNLTNGVPPKPYGLGGRYVVLPQAATAQIYQGAMVAPGSTGALVTGTTSGSGAICGVAVFDQLGGATDGAVRMQIWTDKVFVFAAGTNAPTDLTPFGTVLFAETDNTVGTGAPGQPIAGRFYGFEDDGTVRVYISSQGSWNDSAVTQDGGSAAFKARAVITSIDAYGGSTTGTLTETTASSGLGAQDGVTLAVGDVVFMPAGRTNISAASDAGPYVVVALGSASAKWVLTRPSWWQTGATITPGQTIELDGEGTVFKGATFKAMCGKSQVVDTNDAKLYPKNFRKTVTLASGTYTLGHSGGGEDLFLYDTTLASVQLTMNTPAGTLGTNKLGAPAASRVSGVIGTAAIVINSYVDAGTVSAETSTVDVLVTNW